MAAAPDRNDQDRLAKEFDKLYEKHAKPLEAEHYGEYVAIARDGRILLAETLLEATRRARTEFDVESFISKIGPRVVGKIR